MATNNVISRQDRQSEWFLSFINNNIFGEFDNFEGWDAAQLINFCGRVALAPLLDNETEVSLLSWDLLKKI